MKKLYIIFGILGLFTLMTTSFVAGAILTKADFISKYPDDPIIKTFEGCNGDLACVKERTQEITCVEMDETTYLGKRVIKFRCME